MKRLAALFNKILRKHKKLKNWQRIVTTLAAIVTFITTYALILPAITVEKDKTDLVSGMYVEEALEPVGEVEGAPEENALVPTAYVIAADQENAVTYTYEDDGISAELVISTEEELPEGTELVVNYIDPESDEYTALNSKAMTLLGREFINEMSTCAFYDFALICDEVDVTPASGFADIHILYRNNTIVHTDDALYVGKFALPPDEEGLVSVSANETAAEDELVSVNGDETPVLELSEGIITSLTLKGCDLTSDDSVVGILAGFVDEELKAAQESEMELAASENEEEPEELSDAEVPKNFDENEISSAPMVGTLTASGNDYTVKLTYDETSGVPAGARLKVSEIAQDSKEYEAYLEETKQAMGLAEEDALPQYAARFFDIKIMVGGKEFTPESGVTVEIAYTEPLAAKPETEVSAVHFQDEASEPEVFDVNTTEIAKDGTATIEFQAESFSVYGVIYTVDFHWVVDGKEYDFSIPGGGFVSFEHLVEVLGITEDNTNSNVDGEHEELAGENTSESAVRNEEEEADIKSSDAYGDAASLNRVEVSQAARQFVAEVENVEFSSPSLVWVGKVENESAVGELKDVNGLECEYSAELTEEKIAEINVQTVEAGDWALISMQPFTSEESLTVTMKNGEQFVVKVTDAQISTHVITADGEDYIITVTYGPEAGIPDGAELNAVEIEPGTDAYKSYLVQTEEALGHGLVSDEMDSDYLSNHNAFARFFDISIVAAGKEIEPKAPVSVDITYAGSAAVPNGIIDVVHFADSGVEVIDAVRSNDEDGTIVSFEQGSFSVTGTIIDYSNLADGDYYILFKNSQGKWYALTSAGTPKEVTNYYDTVSGSIVDYDGAENITWTFTKVDGTTSDYVIKAKDQDVYINLQYAPLANDIYHGNVVSNTSETITIQDDANSSDPHVVNIFNYTTQVFTYYNMLGQERQVTADRAYRIGWTSNGVDSGQGGFIFKPDEYMFIDSPYEAYSMGRQTPAGVNLARVSEDSDKISGDYPNMTYNEEQLDQWLNKAMNEHPIQGLSKKASVYDYDNRIYEIDFTAHSGVLAMAQDLSMAFVTDVSNSMLFPASLTPVKLTNGTTMSNVKLNYDNLNQLPHSNGEVYFTIGDKDGTSTVYALWYGPGKSGNDTTSWHAMDASYYARWKANKTVGVNFKKRDITLSSTADNIALHKNDSSTDPDLKYTFYTANDEFFAGLEAGQIYDMSNDEELSDLIVYNDDGTVTINGFNMGNRLYYLESSIASSVKDMQTIAANYPLGSVYVALETFAKTVQKTKDYEKIGGLADNMDAANAIYDANYKKIFDELTAIKGADGTNQYGALSDTTMFGNYANNSFSGGYINNSDIAASKRYVVLITDGAPNADNSDHNKPSNIQTIAERLKANGINVITIGLSIEDVAVAPEILWWAASGVNNTDPYPRTYISNYKPSDSDEPRLFYWAKNGQDLTYILREIVRSVMKKAMVNATITDKIDKLFYPVDRNGVPLKDGDWITEDGTRCDSTDPDRLGKISCDTSGQYSVAWENQELEWEDWTGTIFVKAKEDFLGGNTMATNTEAEAYPVSYAINRGQESELKRTYTADEQAELTESIATPYVNVDNLKMNGNSTDFTVHVGTEVDPKAELTRLWNEIKINEVVKPDGADEKYEMTDENQVFYPFDRSQDKTTSDLLWEGGNPYGTIPLSHYVSIDVLTSLLDDVKGGTATKTATSEPISYAPYGSTNKAGYLTVTLKKTLSYYADDETKNKAPEAHEAENTWLTLNHEGDLTETYELTVEYTPYDPDERKSMLGITETGDAYMNNGDDGPGFEVDPDNTMRSDDVSSYNRHRVYVYARGLQITKTDPYFASVLKGAKFAVYRAATDDDPAVNKETVSGLEGDYVKVADLNASANGVAEIDPTKYPHAIRAQSRQGATYYLVETKPPAGYVTLSPIEVTLSFTDLYTPKPGSVPQQTLPAAGLYDWDQETVLTLANRSEVRMTDEDGQPIPEGSYAIAYYTNPNAYTDLMYYSIANNPGAELPATGGPGTDMFYILGIMLIGLAGTGFMMNRRRRKTA